MKFIFEKLISFRQLEWKRERITSFRRSRISPQNVRLKPAKRTKCLCHYPAPHQTHTQFYKFQGQRICCTLFFLAQASFSHLINDLCMPRQQCAFNDYVMMQINTLGLVTIDVSNSNGFVWNCFGGTFRRKCLSIHLELIIYFGYFLGRISIAEWTIGDLETVIRMSGDLPVRGAIDMIMLWFLFLANFTPRKTYGRVVSLRSCDLEWSIDSAYFQPVFQFSALDDPNQSSWLGPGGKFPQKPRKIIQNQCYISISNFTSIRQLRKAHNARSDCYYSQPFSNNFSSSLQLKKCVSTLCCIKNMMP